MTQARLARLVCESGTPLDQSTLSRFLAGSDIQYGTLATVWNVLLAAQEVTPSAPVRAVMVASRHVLWVRDTMRLRDVGGRFLSHAISYAPVGTAGHCRGVLRIDDAVRAAQQQPDATVRDLIDSQPTCFKPGYPRVYAHDAHVLEVKRSMEQAIKADPFSYLAFVHRNGRLAGLVTPYNLAGITHKLTSRA